MERIYKAFPELDRAKEKDTVRSRESSIHLEKDGKMEYQKKIKALMEAISYFDILAAEDLTAELLNKVEDGEFREDMQKIETALKRFCMMMQ